MIGLHQILHLFVIYLYSLVLHIGQFYQVFGDSAPTRAYFCQLQPCKYMQLLYYFAAHILVVQKVLAEAFL